MSLLSKILNVFQTNKTTGFPQKPVEKRNTFSDRYNDHGKFSYEEDGFVFDTREKIKWSDIEQLTAYKQDLFTFDEVCIDIVYKGYHLTISEETPGWYQFVEKIKLIFPSISNTWEEEVTYPAFKTNLTILYQRVNGEYLT